MNFKMLFWLVVLVAAAVASGHALAVENYLMVVCASIAVASSTIMFLMESEIRRMTLQIACVSVHTN